MQQPVNEMRAMRLGIRSVATALAAILVVGCADQVVPTARTGEETPVNAGARSLSAIEVNTKQGKYLPYGQAVPEDQLVDRLPEPYELSKHGRPALTEVKGISPQKGRTYPNFAPRMGLARPPVPDPTNEHAGIYLNNDSRGIYGLMDVRADVDIPSGWTEALVYAPTNFPGGGSCMEISTIHWRGLDYGVNFNDALGVWDWCNTFGFVHFFTFTTQFRNKYIRSVADEWGHAREKYYLVILADNPAGAPRSYDTWRMLLYNYSSGQYDEVWSIAGVAPRADGWSIHESYRMQGYYNGGACISLPSIRTIGMNVRRPDGTWAPPTAGIRFNSGVLDGTCWGNGSYTLHIDQYTDGDWWAWTPGNSN